MSQEEIAKTIYWAAWEMYPPAKDGPLPNPIARMTKELAWNKTSEEHRKLCRFQAQRVMEVFDLPHPSRSMV